MVYTKWITLVADPHSDIDCAKSSRNLHVQTSQFRGWLAESPRCTRFHILFVDPTWIHTLASCKMASCERRYKNNGISSRALHNVSALFQGQSLRLENVEQCNASGRVSQIRSPEVTIFRFSLRTTEGTNWREAITSRRANTNYPSDATSRWWDYVSMSWERLSQIR
jgi:hypothetical protein